MAGNWMGSALLSHLRTHQTLSQYMNTFMTNLKPLEGSDTCIRPVPHVKDNFGLGKVLSFMPTLDKSPILYPFMSLCACKKMERGFCSAQMSKFKVGNEILSPFGLIQENLSERKPIQPLKLFDLFLHYFLS